MNQTTTHSNSSQDRTRILRSGGIVVGAALAAVLIYFAARGEIASAFLRPAEKITIGTVIYPGSAPVYVAINQGFFEDQGLAVTAVPFISGKAALLALHEGSVDFVTVSDIPFVLAAMQGDKLAALATIFQGKSDQGVIARRDQGIAAFADLRGKKIGMVPGSSSELVLDLMLSSNGMSRHAVQPVPLNNDRLGAGEVAAVSVWQPFLGKLQARLGNKGISFGARDVFTGMLILASRQDLVQAHPQTQRKMLRALLRAADFMRGHADESIALTANAVGIDEPLLRQLWTAYRFDVRLDQSLVITLDETSRWAIRNRLTKAAAIPDYQEFIFPEALEALGPARVNLIRQAAQ